MFQLTHQIIARLSVRAAKKAGKWCWLKPHTHHLPESTVRGNKTVHESPSKDNSMTVEYQSLLQELDRQRQSFDTTIAGFPATTLCSVYVYRLGEVPPVIERNSLLGSQAVAPPYG